MLHSHITAPPSALQSNSISIETQSSYHKKKKLTIRRYASAAHCQKVLELCSFQSISCHFEQYETHLDFPESLLKGVP